MLGLGLQITHYMSVGAKPQSDVWEDVYALWELNANQWQG